jgi:hypothetical protein
MTDVVTARTAAGEEGTDRTAMVARRRSSVKLVRRGATPFTLSRQERPNVRSVRRRATPFTLSRLGGARRGVPRVLLRRCRCSSLLRGPAGVARAAWAAIAVLAVNGCGGGGAVERPPPVSPAGSAADLRAPDRLGRLQAAFGAQAFACATDGVLEVRFAGRDGVTLAGGGPPLAFARAGVRLVRRDCTRRVAPTPRPPAGGARVITRAAAVRCAVPATVSIAVARLGTVTRTRVLVSDPRTRRLVVSAVVSPAGGRLFVARACRPADEARVSP